MKNIPFQEALDHLAQKELLPTALSFAQLTKLPAQLRQRSLFSARTTNATYLQQIKDQTEALLQGKFNEATARAKLQDTLDSLQYNPDTQFGTPADASIPPADPGTLRDLSSDARIRLILETQERQAANYGYLLQGQGDVARFQYPAWELLRIYTRQKERTGPSSWPSRWEQVGGQFYGGGRMIAPKDDPLWSELGSTANFPDALDTPFPPFAFSSGMGWREVPRQDCIDLGVIPEDFTPEFSDPGFLPDLKLQADRFDPEFLKILRSELPS